jgi:muconolactone delta-isomerase
MSEETSQQSQQIQSSSSILKPGTPAPNFTLRSTPDLREILASLPLHIWMQVTITPLTPHPNDPEYRASQSIDQPQA